MEWISSPEAWIALATLAILEIVLGIDNIIFISILADKLPEEQQPAARRNGLILAMATRLALLGAISFIMRLTAPLFSVLGHGYSGRDLILIGGGLFLLAKATREVHHRLEGDEEGAGKARAASYGAVLAQIAVMDIVFSLDSVITAVGLAEDFMVMAIAIVLAVVVMLLAANAVSEFVNNHPTVKMLALSFLLLLGMTLVAEGFGQHIPKGYIYFAMGFSVFVEALNLRVRAGRKPVQLRRPPRDPDARGKTASPPSSEPAEGRTPA
ncbi:MAG: TerC family protein [Gemmatimonadota bacterium]|nr:TerC family protein [Gemmatimonadota bacterium]MDE2866729.1 TerC family protein [Gemmatimonadota bacterium]MYB06502.1 TerC family protein [Gemmatimonadota bacterium]MYG22444.1 TerC family protein [Gemmatimonadota bacterium]MYJ39873.1 TerC family protein [Gemmatimonadota bacterium]